VMQGKLTIGSASGHADAGDTADANAAGEPGPRLPIQLTRLRRTGIGSSRTVVAGVIVAEVSVPPLKIDRPVMSLALYPSRWLKGNAPGVIAAILGVRSSETTSLPITLPRRIPESDVHDASISSGAALPLDRRSPLKRRCEADSGDAALIGTAAVAGLPSSSSGGAFIESSKVAGVPLRLRRIAGFNGDDSSGSGRMRTLMSAVSTGWLPVTI